MEEKAKVKTIEKTRTKTRVKFEAIRALRSRSRTVTVGFSDILSEELIVRSLNNPTHKFRSLISKGGVVAKYIERTNLTFPLIFSEREDVEKVTDLVGESIGVINPVVDVQSSISNINQVEEYKMIEALSTLELSQSKVYSINKIAKKKTTLNKVFDFMDDIEKFWGESYGYMELKHRFPDAEQLLFGKGKGGIL